MKTVIAVPPRDFDAVASRCCVLRSPPVWLPDRVAVAPSFWGGTDSFTVAVSAYTRLPSAATSTTMALRMIPRISWVWFWAIARGTIDPAGPFRLRHPKWPLSRTRPLRGRGPAPAKGGDNALMPIVWTDNPEANRLLETDPLALLIGLVLDQQVKMEKAFSGPYELKQRLGDLDPRKIAAMDPDKLGAVFRERPALHRFPGSMAQRVQALCQAV